MLDAWADDVKALDSDDRDATLKRMRADNRALNATHDGALEACYAYLTGLVAVHPEPDAVANSGRSEGRPASVRPTVRSSVGRSG